MAFKDLTIPKKSGLSNLHLSNLHPPQRNSYLLRNKRPRISPANNNLSNNRTADVRELRLCNQKHRLDAPAYDVIELRDGFFVIEVGRVAQAAQQEAGTDALAVVGREVFKAVHTHTRFFFKDLTQPFHALFVGEQVFFGAVDAYRHDDLVKQRQGSFHQVHMTNGDWVEGTGKDCEFFVHGT